MAPVLTTVKHDLERFEAAHPTLAPLDERPELQEAKRILTELLRPLEPPREEVEEPTVEVWSPADLWIWWEEQSKPVDHYTLDGDLNWPLLFPNDSTPKASRKEKLCSKLAQPAGEGAEVWYRLLGLACLMSAGWGATGRLRTFWRNTLEPAPHEFWKRTAEGDFSESTQALFSELILRSHPNANATGEDAEYWRHVFYDIRKVHELIRQRNFAGTVWDLISDRSREASFAHFLRQGEIGSQTPWAGVLGQSAGSPLFFLARELFRLGLTSPGVRPLSYFVCGPVRRAACSIGWLAPGLARAVDFKSLARASEIIHKRISEDHRFNAVLDIPLLHMGLTSDRLPPPRPDV